MRLLILFVNNRLTCVAHPGEMEKTMFHRFCEGQNLRALFHQVQLPEALHPIITEYEKAYNANIRGTFINDAQYFSQSQQGSDPIPSNTALTTLSKAHHHLLTTWIMRNDIHMTNGRIPNKAVMRPRRKYRGQHFQISAMSGQDSNVIYRNPPGSDWSAGSITNMFSHTRIQSNGTEITQDFLVVSEYMPLIPSHADLDPYRKFPTSGGRLLYPRFKTKPIILAIDDVICQTSHCIQRINGIEEELLHVLLLDKVSFVSETWSALISWIIHSIDSTSFVTVLECEAVLGCSID